MVHHGAGLRRLAKDHHVVESILNLEFQSPLIDSTDQALLSYAIKLTRTPSAITADDVESLRSQGFDDLGRCSGYVEERGDPMGLQNMLK